MMTKTKALYPLSASILTSLLKDAKDAHTAHEKLFGADPNWPEWYADYMIKRLENEPGVSTNLCALSELPFPPYQFPHDEETLRSLQAEEIARTYDRLERERDQDEDPTL